MLFSTLLAPLVMTLALLVLFCEKDEALLEGVDVIDDFRDESAVDLGVAPFGDMGETGDIGDIGVVAVTGFGLSLGFTEVAGVILAAVVGAALAGADAGAGLAGVGLAGAGTRLIPGDCDGLRVLGLGLAG